MNLPNNPSDSTKRRNPHLYLLKRAEPIANPPQLRLGLPGEGGLNKTETRYLAWLKTLKDDWIGIQCLRFQLAEKCWYLPDFVAYDLHGLRAIDVKAFWKSMGKPGILDDSLVKIKCSARMYPWCRFILAWEQDGIWHHHEMKG